MGRHGKCPVCYSASCCQRVIIATFLLGESIGRWLQLAKTAFIHLSLHVRCSYVLFLQRASRLCSGWKPARWRKTLRSKNSSAPRKQHLHVRWSVRTTVTTADFHIPSQRKACHKPKKVSLHNRHQDKDDQRRMLQLETQIKLQCLTNIQSKLFTSTCRVEAGHWWKVLLYEVDASSGPHRLLPGFFFNNGILCKAVGGSETRCCDVRTMHFVLRKTETILFPKLI